MQRTRQPIVAASIFSGLVVASATSSLSNYGYLRESSLGGGVILHVGTCTQTQVQLAIDVPLDGWAAFAVGRSMTDADAVIGEGSTVKAYRLTAASTAGVAENPSVTSQLSDTSVLRNGGRTQVLFKRPLDNGVKSLSCNGNVDILYAYGSGSLSYHGGNKAAVSVNLQSLSVKEDTTVRDHKVLHGILMMASWGFLLPIGTLAAVWGGPHFSQLGPKAFKMHRGVQVVGLAVALIGVVYALGNIYSSATSMPTHGVLGLIIMSVGVLQPLNALLRPHGTDSKPRRLWELLHKNAGRAATVAGLINCIVGSALVKDQHTTDGGFNVMLVLSILFTSVFVTAFVAGKIWIDRRQRRVPEPPPVPKDKE